VNIEKIINEIGVKMLHLSKTTRLMGLSLEHHDDIKPYNFLHGNKECIYCTNKKELIDVLKRREILFRKF
jgi:hypothetical protein